MEKMILILLCMICVILLSVASAYILLPTASMIVSIIIGLLGGLIISFFILD